MSIDLDDEILQDFLVEAGEILELLGEQLVELEQHPENMDLINAIFRGFHTVKGGAGFLSLTELVNISHKTEDVFNLVRQGERVANSGLMDVILRSLDVINEMFDGIQNGIEPEPADAGLLAELAQLADASIPQDSIGDTPTVTADVSTDEPASVAEPEPDSNVEAQPEGAVSVSDITETDYSEMLDSLDGEGKTPQSNAASSQDDITEEEFDQLLDDIHGKGKHGRVDADSDQSKTETETAASDSAQPTGVKSDEITEEEFDKLLDELHGAGKHGRISPEESEALEKAGDENITDEQFQALLDEMHGAGKGPTKAVKPADAKPVAKAADSAKPDETVAPKPTPVAKPAASKTAAAKPAAGAAGAGAAKAEATVRVDTKRLDDIMNLVGELVLARNRLTSLREEYENEQMVQAVNNLDLVTADLQGAVMKTRMQPIKKVFGRFPRVVRDLARSLNKEVHLELMGEETDLDKNLVEALADPLVHLVRNAVDHGIETPEERKANGKPAGGTVVLAAEQSGDHILLTIRDDGAGMDPNVLREMAVRKEIMDAEAAKRLTDKECFDLIFMPGTSTKTEISDVSGRGVGMDVVKTRISQLNGSVDIDSVKGKGTTLSIKVPLTLAILPTLMVVLGERKFALPLSIVNEIFELDTKPTHVVDGQRVIQNRGKAPPLFFLRNWLLSPEEANQPKAESENGEQVLMVQINNRPVGFVVDQVVGQEEVVIKPLGSVLHGLPGLAGATITGDGNMALILDMPGLVKKNAAFA
ncbi:MAG: chemotaxis protein CheA [Pseudomonadota bacterium]